MRKIIAITQVTLEGVMQAPGGPEEDPNGFTHGGWAMPFGDDAVSQAFARLSLVSSTCFWDGEPTRSSPPTGHKDSPIAKALNVFTRSLDQLE